MFRLAITNNPPKTSAQISSAKITASQLKTFVEDMITIASKFSLNASSEEVTLNSNYENSASSLATSLMHDINFPGNKSRKVISSYFSQSSNHPMVKILVFKNF